MSTDRSAHLPARVLITARSVAGSMPALALMREAGIEVIVDTAPVPFDEAWLVARVADVDALVVALEPVGARVFEAAPRLKLIARPGVGYDSIDLEAAARHGVVVSLALGTNDQSVADFTFALLLEATRGVSASSRSVAAGGWDRFTGTEIWNKTMAVVGLGRIGQGVARRARGFGMRVLAVSRHPDPAFVQQHQIEVVTLDQALHEADVVSLNLPLTPATANLIGAAALAKMKPGAYLINTARGGLVDEAALADAVRSGRLAGAAVDVLREQGAGSRSPLIGVPGIVVTPHMGAFTREATARVAMSVARDVVAVLGGGAARHVAPTGG